MGCSLIFTRNTQDERINFKPIFFGKIDILQTKDRFAKSYIELLKKYSQTSDQKIIHYKNCENLFEEILKDLGNNLNQINKVNFSYRSWDIILGRWLRIFICTAYENYIIIKKIFEDNDISQVITIDPDKHHLYTLDTNSLRWAVLEEEWNHVLCSKIINFFKFKTKIELQKINLNHLENQKIFEENLSKKKIIVKFFLKILNFKNNNNSPFIYKSHLPFLKEKILEIKLGTFPKFWSTGKLKFDSFDKELRNKIDIRKKNFSGNFEDFLRDVIPNSLPVFVLESFKKINNLSNNIGYPENPKFIFTSEAYAFDEVFKFYLAKKTQQGIPYYVGQHGNNYFTNLQSNHVSEIKTCDKYFSWGSIKSDKIYPSFNFNVWGKSSKVKKNGKLLFVFRYVFNDTHLFDGQLQDYNSIYSSLEILKNLNSIVKKDTIIKLNLNSHHLKKLILKENLGISTIIKDDKEKSFNSLLNRSRLTFFNYDSTGILENLALNNPTLCYWDNTFNHINPEYKGVYMNLVEAKILFLDKKKLTNHINENWQNLDEWWNSKKTQKYLNNFNSKLNIKPTKNSINNFINNLKQ